MGVLIVCTAFALLIGLVVFLDVRRASQAHSDRTKWVKDIQQRRHDRAVANAAAVRGEFHCTACGKAVPTVDAEKMGAIADAFDAALIPAAPRIVVCDDCYRSIMGDDPPRLVVVNNNEERATR